MRSRILIGTGAWLLGAVAATTSSLYAVDQIGRGLLAQNVNQVSVAMVNAELPHERSGQAPSASPSPPGSPTPRRTEPARIHSAAPSPTADPGQLLTAEDGTVVAVCKPGGAYLEYWSPQQGYETEHVRRGPQPVASVMFIGPSQGEIVRVTCSAGQPVKRVAPLRWGDDGGGHGGDDH